jgi:drug/metabolite transporter (DMT)-like permease
MSFTNDFLEHAWIPITIAAALMQALRTGLQKRLTLNLSATANTLARYLYGLPFVLVYLSAVLTLTGEARPTFNTSFLINCVVGGLAQIAATALLILSFTGRSYAVGTALSKTEAVQAAVLATIVLGEHISLGGGLALIISVVGVMAMSAPGNTWSTRFDRAALFGLCAGAMFGVTAVCIRGANLALGGSFITSAAFTLAVMVSLQTAALGLYVIMRTPLQFRELMRAWRPSLAVGLFSALGSVGWFTGMALEKAAYVRTLGQVELVFTVLISRLYFHETLRPRELGGMVLIVAGIVVLVLVA